jgi:hypothetical protein
MLRWFVLLPAVCFVSQLLKSTTHTVDAWLAMANKAYGGGVELLNKICFCFFVCFGCRRYSFQLRRIYKSLSSGIAKLFITLR